MRRLRVFAATLALASLAAPAVAAQDGGDPASGATTTGVVDPLAELDRLAGGLPSEACLTVSVDGHRVVDHNGTLPLIPASNQKLLTALWALTVAPELTFTTRVTATGAHDGRAATLHLVGGADPMLSTDAFASARTEQYSGRWATSLDRLADRVAAAGIVEVGALLGDGGLLPRQLAIPEWRSLILDDGHTGPLGALTVNHGFAYDPAEPAGARWSADPALDAVRHLARLLRDRGVRVGWIGTARAPADAMEVASVTSARVRDLVQELLTESDNNTAEGLLQGIGRLVLGTDGSVAAGASAVQTYLGERGLGEAGTTGVDGSGLSRDDRTTCNQLERILLAAGPGSELAGSLAVACRSGTLEHLLCGTPADGALRAKTGTLGVSKALSGFLTGASGRSISFSFVVNGNGSAGIAMRAWVPLVQALSLL